MVMEAGLEERLRGDEGLIVRVKWSWGKRDDKFRGMGEVIGGEKVFLLQMQDIYAHRRGMQELSCI